MKIFSGDRLERIAFESDVLDQRLEAGAIFLGDDDRSGPFDDVEDLLGAVGHRDSRH